MQRIIIIAWLLLVTTILSPNIWANEQLTKQYKTDWGKREILARTAEAQRQLATDLLKEAKKKSNQNERVFYCDKAYQWGQRKLHGYAIAADALDHLQRFDPTQRIDALTKLEQLYAIAYRLRPTVLRLGTGQAQVLEQIAEERLSIIQNKLEAGKLNATDANRQIALTIKDLTKGSMTLQRVILRAKSDARKMIKRDNKLAEKLIKFANETEPIKKQFDQKIKAVNQTRKRWLQLQIAESQFKRLANATNAEKLAMTYHIEFDRPELTPQSVANQLDKTYLDILKLSCRAPRNLSKDERQRVTDWYVNQSNGNQPGIAKQLILTRTQVYLSVASENGNDKARPLLTEMNDKLNALVTQKQAEQLTDQLQARLHFQFGQPQAIASTEQPTEKESVPESDPKEIETENPPIKTPEQPQKIATSTPPKQPKPDTVIATTTTMTQGRKLVQCETCGRQFFPGWGVNNETKCPRCKEGRKNIFDITGE